jgi:hypothetical protein
MMDHVSVFVGADIDATDTGGSSYNVHVGHALEAIAARRCNVALVTLAAFGTRAILPSSAAAAVGAPVNAPDSWSGLRVRPPNWLSPHILRRYLSEPNDLRRRDIGRRTSATVLSVSEDPAGILPTTRCCRRSTVAPISGANDRRHSAQDQLCILSNIAAFVCDIGRRRGISIPRMRPLRSSHPTASEIAKYRLQ